MRTFKNYPLLKLLNSYVVDSPTPSNISYLWNFGSLLAFCLIIQIITGVTLSMHYNSNVLEAFDSVEHIMRDVNNGWLIRYLHSNTASAFFFLVYLHIGRGLYYGSYKAPRTLVWVIGTIIFLLMIATAFLGYVLPFGQMSLWGATVITNLMSAIPWVGQDIVEFIWGGFSVNNSTLNRFFALHFVLPFILAALALMHLISLHDRAGSSNPLGINGNSDRIPFAPYFIFKDLITLFIFMVVLSLLVFYMPNILGDSENYVMANPMQTPSAIVPEWYLLPFYAILRSIPSKLLGVIAMFFAILILLAIPFADLSRSRGNQFRPLSKIIFFIFVCNFFILMKLGAEHVESPFIELGQISTVLYFSYFLIIVPLTNLTENSLTELREETHEKKNYNFPFIIAKSFLITPISLSPPGSPVSTGNPVGQPIPANIAEELSRLAIQSSEVGIAANNLPDDSPLKENTMRQAAQYKQLVIRRIREELEAFNQRVLENENAARGINDTDVTNSDHVNDSNQGSGYNGGNNDGSSGGSNGGGGNSMHEEESNKETSSGREEQNNGHINNKNYAKKFLYPVIFIAAYMIAYWYISYITAVDLLITSVNKLYTLAHISSLLDNLHRVALCDAPKPWGIYFQDSGTPQMEALVELHDIIMFYLVIILFGVGWILISIVNKYNIKLSPISRKYQNHGTSIELIWTVTPAIILMLIAFPSFKLLYLMDEVSDPSMVVLAEGHQWYWSYQYADFMNDEQEFLEYDSYQVPESDLEDGALRMLEVDNRLIMPESTHVRFVVGGADVIHCFACPSLGIKCDAYPGRLNQTSVMINRPSTFYGQCSEICGVLHSSMPIVIEAVSIEKFISWLLGQ